MNISTSFAVDTATIAEVALRHIVHDFRNQLTVIRGGSDVLMMGHGLSASDRSLLEDIRDASQRLCRLTQQIGECFTADPESLALSSRIREMAAQPR